MGIFAHVPFAALWQPDLMAASAVLQAAYLVVVGPGRTWFEDAQPVPAGKVVAALGALWLFYGAFGSPVDYVADTYLFSVHMVEHILEVYAVVPLLLIGIPDWLVRPLFRWDPSSAFLRFLTHPVAALILFAGVFTLWHAPILYDAALTSERVHFLEHAMFFVASVGLWWPLIGPLPDESRLTEGLKLLYITWAFNLTMPINLLLILSNAAWYSPYAQAPRLFGLTALGDQQVGGIVMAVGGALVFGSIAAVALFRYDPAIWYE